MYLVPDYFRPLWQQPKDMLVDTGSEGAHQAEGGLLDLVNLYCEESTRVWEELGEAMEKDFRSASKRF